MKCVPLIFVMLLVPLVGFSQEAPTGAHYGGRASDTGHGGTFVNASGAFPASIPLDLPGSRGNLPVPLEIVYGGRGVGAAGLNWDIHLSYILRDRTLAHRRPAFSATYGLPTLRERAYLSLLGQRTELVFDGQAWLARVGTLELNVRDAGTSWIMYDGQGTIYTFMQPAQLANTGLWLLKFVEGPGNKLELTYRINTWPLEGGAGAEINLIKIAYNRAFSLNPGECFKHEIELTYGHVSSKPYSMSLFGEKVLTRNSTVSQIDVMSRATCGASPERLRRYVFDYPNPDPDTGLPRLRQVRLLGRQGSAEENSALPIATFEYGTATTEGKLKYNFSQTVMLPADDTGSGNQIGGTIIDSSVVAPGSGEKNATWHSLTDVTGDGRPDIIFRKNDKLWMARNRAAAGGKTTLGNPSTVQLHDASFKKGGFAAHTTTKRRLWWGSANSNTVDVWRQAIDVNGDGRIDVIDAGEKTEHWVVYLNTPGSFSPVEWRRSEWNVKNLRLELESRGHKLQGGFVPLSRRTTGVSVTNLMCLTQESVDKWKPYSGTLTKTIVNENGPITLTYKCDAGRLTSAPAPPPPPCLNGQMCPPPKSDEAERTFVEWDFLDLNGDAYPDFVYNDLPIEQVPQPSQNTTPIDRVLNSAGEFVQIGEARLTFQLPSTSAISAAFNRVGTRWGTETSPFAKSIYLLPDHSSGFGVGRWEGADMEGKQQRQRAGLAEVNGDGLVDYVVSRFEGNQLVTRAYLGVYLGTVGAFSNVNLILPGSLSVQMTDRRKEQCASGPIFTSYLPVGLRDLTGDGFPDYYASGRVWIGTGTGFASPVDVDQGTYNFVFSHQTESCLGDYSFTDGGLFDLDGDGKPEVLGLVPVPGGRAYVVSQLVGGSSAPGKPEAGRLTFVDNGYGGQTQIAYQSAKEDLFTSHQVPFPEIVVSAVGSGGAFRLGASLTRTRYAYGNAEMVFDSAHDGYTFPGYQRRVEMPLFDGPGFSPNCVNTNCIVLQSAPTTVVDNWPLTSFSISLTKELRWLRQQRVGRVRDVFTLRGSHETDPWPLLQVDQNDVRVIGVTHHDWGAKFFELPANSNANFRDCFDMVIPYSYNQSFADVEANQLDMCRAHGFPFALSKQSWYGPQAPPSNNNVQTRSRVRSIDDFGRVTSIQYEGDVFKGDDNVCVQNNFATPAFAFPRVLSALASRQVTSCDGEVTWANESFEYDQLTPGSVSNGWMTSHTVERRNTYTGQLLNRIRSFDATYDGFGNLKTINTQRSGAERKVSFEYDPFQLVPTSSKVTASGLPSTEASVTYDPISLARLSSVNLNGTRRGAEFDGFGRPRRSTVTPPGGSLGVLATIDYQGFTAGDANGRRIVTKEFSDAVSPDQAPAAAGQLATAFLDEFGRAQRSEIALGADYGNDKLISGYRVFDQLGRVAFEADPFLQSQTPTPYGTSYHFDSTGELNCFIRGHGPQPFNRTTDATAERFPTCFQRSFVDHVDTLDVQGPDAFVPQGSGVVKRTISSAIGRVLERSTVRHGTRIDHAAFLYDALGQLRIMTRYLDPVGATNPVQLIRELDSLGQTLKLVEPQTATRTYSYSDWGEPTETSWTDAGIERKLLSSYDALGRLTSTVESNNGMQDAETLRAYAYDIGAQLSPLSTPTFVAGRLSVASSASGQVGFSYDAFGRVNARTFTDREGKYYLEKSRSAADGSLLTLEFNLPDRNYQAEQITYGYDSARRLRTIKHAEGASSRELYRADIIDPLGRTRKATYGGNTLFTAQYADTGRRLIREAKIESSMGLRQVKFLEFDVLGREQLRAEKTNNASSLETRTSYDALGRVLTVSKSQNNTAVEGWRFLYDQLGNVTRLVEVSGSLSASLSYQPAGDLDRICRVGYGASGLGGTTCNVMHDGLGNIVNQPTRSGSRQLSYFASGNVRNIHDQGTTARFAYDAFGNVQELDVQGNSVPDARHDRRFGGLIEQRNVTSGGSTSSMIVRHIPGPGGVTASRRGSGNEWVFEFGELRGNRFFTDQNGAFVQSVDYHPFGEPSSTGEPAGSARHTSYQWNGGDALGAFGLSHLGARVYDPVIGRFLSRDPLVAPRGAATTNPYSFAMNDPVNAADPSGLQCIPGGECDPWPTPPWGGGGGSGSGQPKGPDPVKAPSIKVQIRKALRSGGPVTEEGQTLKTLAALLLGATFTDSFDFDSVARNSKDWEEALDIISNTQNAQEAVDSYNASIDTMSSTSAGIGDALNWTCMIWCSGPGVRADFGITSGDADQSSYWISNVVTMIGTLFMPGPKEPRPPGIRTLSITNEFSAGGGGSRLTQEATAAEVVGRRGAPIEIQAGRNLPEVIGGRAYSGHALDRMQGRGLLPTVIENAIQTYIPSAGNMPGTLKYFDSLNNVTAIVDTATGRVITVW